MAFRRSHLEFNVVLLGPPNVGKTAIIYRIKHGFFNDETRRTFGPTSMEVKKTIKDKEVTLQLWDTAGVERYGSAGLRQVLKMADAVGFVCDLTNAKSLRDLDNYIQLVHEHCNKQVLKFVVGNKCEEEASSREIKHKELQDFADTNDISIFYEVSAKRGYNINEVTKTIIKELYSNRHKVVIVGQSAVGKTKLVNMLQGSDQPTTPTRVNREHEIELESHRALIIDTPGGEAHSSVTRLEKYRDADGFVFVFNCTSKESFDTASDWFEKIRWLRGRNKNMQFMFIANDKREENAQNVVVFNTESVHIKDKRKDIIVRQVKVDDAAGAKEAFQELLKQIHSAKLIENPNIYFTFLKFVSWLLNVLAAWKPHLPYIVKYVLVPLVSVLVSVLVLYYYRKKLCHLVKCFRGNLPDWFNCLNGYFLSNQILYGHLLISV